MRKRLLRGALLLFVGASVLVLVNIVVASLLGLGFAQNYPMGHQPAGQSPTGQSLSGQPYHTQQPHQSPVQPMGTPQSVPQNANVLLNNSSLPNLGVNTLNTATGDVVIPYQLDTSRMMAFSVVVDNECQILTVLDPVNQSIAVYRISLREGEYGIGTCELKSVRNISADLKYVHYNGLNPLPEEMRANLEKINKK